MMTNTYQNQLQLYLQASTLTPGMYTPSIAVKEARHVAVCVDCTPILLTGLSDDKESINQANAFCRSAAFTLALKTLGFETSATGEFIEGNDIDWPASCEAVVESEPGAFEIGGNEGDLMTINLSQNRGLTTLLCVNTELAHIIDPHAPNMCDGRTLSMLAKQSPKNLAFN